MKLGIYTIEKTLYEGEVSQIVLKTASGEITVLPNHAPLISQVLTGPVRLTDAAGKEKIIEISSGFVEVQPESNVMILADA